MLSTDGATAHPLASGFSILDGHVVVQVPDVPTGDDYAIVREWINIYCAQDKIY